MNIYLYNIPLYAHVCAGIRFTYLYVGVNLYLCVCVGVQRHALRVYMYIN